MANDTTDTVDQEVDQSDKDCATCKAAVVLGASVLGAIVTIGLLL